MNRSVSIHRSLTLLFLLLLTPRDLFGQSRFLPAETDGVADQYIVVLAEGVALEADKTDGSYVDEVAARLAELYGGTVERTWEHGWQGFQIRLDEAQAQKLAFDPLVARVKQDRQPLSFKNLPSSCYGLDPLQSAGLSLKATQSIVCDDPDPRNPSRNCTDNWGLDRIGQTSSARDGAYNFTSTGAGIHIYVLDTGIQAQHVEFIEPGPPWTRVIGGTYSHS